MRERTDDPLGDYGKDKRYPIRDNPRDPITGKYDSDPLGDFSNVRDPLGGLNKKDRGDPLGQDENDRDDSLADLANKDKRDSPREYAHERPNEGVGYCKPPKQYTWKKGQSANPKGRKKGSKNESTILRDLMNRKFKIREGKKVRTVTFLEGMLLNFAEDSLNTKNTKTAAFLLNRYGLVSGDAQPNEISEDDRAVLKAFVKRATVELEKEDDGP